MGLTVDVLEFTTWSEFSTRLEALRPNRLFRGQKDAEWGLCTSLERYTPASLSSKDVEAAIVAEFEKRVDLHVAGRNSADILELLARMQHWGAPTRLLDFTASPYIAAYFAVEEAARNDSPCAVWIVDELACRKSAGEMLRPEGSPYDPVLFSWMVGSEPDYFRNTLWKKSTQCVIPVTPRRNSDRMSLQQGVFLFPGDPSATFEDNLAANHMQPFAIKKYVLKGEYRRALEHLRTMNITRETLFPGLEGLAQSLRYLPLAESREEWRIRQIRESLTDPGASGKEE